MIYNRAFSDPHFSQTHQTLTRGIFILGGVLFFLATFIFIFPAFVATSIAGLFFLAGVFVLTVAWKLSYGDIWCMRNEEKAAHPLL